MKTGEAAAHQRAWLREDLRQRATVSSLFWHLCSPFVCYFTGSNVAVPTRPVWRAAGEATMLKHPRSQLSVPSPIKRPPSLPRCNDALQCLPQELRQRLRHAAYGHERAAAGLRQEGDAAARAVADDGARQKLEDYQEQASLRALGREQVCSR